MRFTILDRVRRSLKRRKEEIKGIAVEEKTLPCSTLQTLATIQTMNAPTQAVIHDQNGQKRTTRLEDIEREMEQLAIERRELEETASKRCACILPADILLEIFQHYVDSAESSQPATVLTQVCSTWRRVAYSATPLWTTVHAPHITQSVVSQTLSTLSRSSPHSLIPLNLGIRLVAPQRNAGSAADDIRQRLTQASELMAACMAHLERWGSLDFVCEASSAPALPRISQDVILPMLERLSLRFYRNSDADVDSQALDLLPCGMFMNSKDSAQRQWAYWAEWTSSLIRAAPRLRDLKLSGPAPSPEERTRALPFALDANLMFPDLRSVDLTGHPLSSTALLALISQFTVTAPGLEVCRVGVVSGQGLEGEWSPDMEESKTIVHPAVHTFELLLVGACAGEDGEDGDDSDIVRGVLGHLEFPELRDISIHLGGETDASHVSFSQSTSVDWPHEEFLEFLQRSSSGITSLSLSLPVPSTTTDASFPGYGMYAEGAEIPEEHLLEYLAAPNVRDSLERLAIRQRKAVSNEVLDYLTFSGQDASTLDSSSSSELVLPKLHSIALPIDPIFQVLPFRDFVRSRWWVAVDGADPPSPPSISRLRDVCTTLCIPAIPNLVVDSKAIKQLFERLEMEEADLKVEWRSQTYDVMPLDVPLLPEDLII